MKIIAIATTLALLVSVALNAAGFVPPDGSGVLNVRDYGAVGDGKTDDTAAIQKALSEGLDRHIVVYLPDGEYLVSDTLKWWREGVGEGHTNGWGAFLMLQGQSRENTIIRLKNSADGYGDPASPKAIIATGSRGYHGKKNYKQGEGNEAFENNIRDLTVDAGTGNPGAIGIDYQVSNSGAIRDVTVRSSDTGAIGIGLLRRDNGPGSIVNVKVEGFAAGIAMNQEIAQIILEYIELIGQTDVAIRLDNGCIAARKITTKGSVPAIRAGRWSYLVLMDSTFEGTGPTSRMSAIEFVGSGTSSLLQRVSSSGYSSLISQDGKAGEGSEVALWTHPTQITLGRASQNSLPDVEIRETPPIPDLTDQSRWAVAKKPNGFDDVKNLQDAMDAGKPIVCLPAGRYKIKQSIKVPAGVEMVFGLGAEISAAGDLAQNAEAPIFVIADNAATPVIFDRMTLGGKKKGMYFLHTSNRPMFLRDLLGFSGEVYHSSPEAGALFVDDVAGGGYQIRNKAGFWGRQWDVESGINVIDGAPTWVLGFKVEGGRTLATVKGGANTQIFGGLFYSFGKVTKPCVVIEDSWTALSFVGSTFVSNGFHPELIQYPGGVLKAGDAPKRSNAAAVPLAIFKP